MLPVCSSQPRAGYSAEPGKPQFSFRGIGERISSAVLPV